MVLSQEELKKRMKQKLIHYPDGESAIRFLHYIHYKQRKRIERREKRLKKHE